MTSDGAGPSGGDGPSIRAIRMWVGFLVAVWIVVQIVAVCVSFVQAGECRREERGATASPNRREDAAAAESPNRRDDAAADRRAAYWHSATVGLGTAVLAMGFMVGGTGLVMAARWSWGLLALAAGLQIVSTVATQVWEATLTPLEHGLDRGSMGAMGAAMGILLWNVIPVGILILSLAGRKRAAARPETP